MARKLDEILVVDVESTCWDGPPPEGEESEIIEIGLCVVDVDSLSRLSKHSILVKPQRSTISSFLHRTDNAHARDVRPCWNSAPALASG